MVRWAQQRGSEESELGPETVSPHLTFSPFSGVILWAHKTKVGLKKKSSVKIASFLLLLRQHLTIKF